MALYADENFPLRVVEELRRLGHNVITAFEDGKANQSITDQDLLARAIELDRAVLTLNRVELQATSSSNAEPCRDYYLHRRSGSYRTSETNNRVSR